MITTFKSWVGAYKESAEKRKLRCFTCGECCRAFGGHLASSPADRERWRLLGREDVLSRVNRLGWIWVDPQTKEPEDTCPFLTRTGPDTAVCSIYDIRPDICRAYPTVAHGKQCLRGVCFSLAVLPWCLPDLSEIHLLISPFV